VTLYKGNEITYRLPRNYLCSMTWKALSHKGLRSKRLGGLPRLPFSDGQLEEGTYPPSPWQRATAWTLTSSLLWTYALWVVLWVRETIRMGSHNRRGFPEQLGRSLSPPRIQGPSAQVLGPFCIPGGCHVEVDHYC